MTDNPLVSIIVPVYKVENFLDRCVESLTAQSYGNIEIVLVDDGSPDACPAMCDGWAARDGRIKVIHKPNGGLSDARNSGVAVALGAYISFVDSDDYVSPDYVEYLLSLLKNNSADIACGSFRYVYGAGETFEGQSQEKAARFDNIAACHALMTTHWMPMVAAWAKLFPAGLVKANPFPVGRLHEDEATIYKYYFGCAVTALGTREIYAYYQNSASITHTKSRRNSEDTLLAFQEQCAFFGAAGCRELQVTAAERLISTAVVMALRKDQVAVEFLSGKEAKKYLRSGVGIKTRLRYIGYVLFRADLNQLYHKIISK